MVYALRVLRAHLGAYVPQDGQEHVANEEDQFDEEEILIWKHWMVRNASLFFK